MKSLWNRLIQLDRSSSKSLQIQIREGIVTAALERMLEVDKPLPSSRELAKELNVARNTIVLAYQHLVDEGFLDSHERKGFFICQVLEDNLPSIKMIEGCGFKYKKTENKINFYTLRQN